MRQRSCTGSASSPRSLCFVCTCRSPLYQWLARTATLHACVTSGPHTPSSPNPQSRHARQRTVKSTHSGPPSPTSHATFASSRAAPPSSCTTTSPGASVVSTPGSSSRALAGPATNVHSTRSVAQSPMFVRRSYV